MAKPPAKKRKTGQGGAGHWQPRMWRPTPIRRPTLGLAAVKHQQAQAQAMAERAVRLEQQGRAFAALAHVMAAAGEGAKAAPRPHRPTPSLGQCCAFCRNMFTWNQLKRHYAGGCPALKAG